MTSVLSAVRRDVRAATGALDVCDIELTSAPREIEVSDDSGGVRALVRFRGEACGRLTLPAPSSGRIEVAAALKRAVLGGDLDGILGVLARRAVSLGTTPGDSSAVARIWHSEPLATPAPMIGLTVAICTRDRPEGVAHVLASLASHLHDPAVECLVVDNAPTNHLTRQAASDARIRVRYVVEETPGLDHARNTALRHARGDVVAFADDDVMVDSEWSTRIRQRFDANPELTLLTGLVEPASLATQAERWFEAYGGFGRGYSPRWILAPNASERSIAFKHANTGRYGTGANLAIRRAAALKLGGFDPSLDVGTATRGGGDLEMMFRVLKGEGVIAYAPDVVIRHAHRLTWEELASQIESWGSGMVAHLTRTARAHADERIAVQALRSWLYSTWFAKRLAFSYAYEPFPRELIQRELRGSFRGRALYEKASLGYPTPQQTPLIAEPTKRASASLLRIERELGTDGDPIEAADASSVLVNVVSNGHSLGSVTMYPVDGWIGATRLRDTIAARLRKEILGDDIQSLRRAVWLELATGMTS